MRSRKLKRGGIVTIATVLGLVAAMGLTILGLGAADNAVASYDASSWLWSSLRSEMARVNGVTGRVDTRLQIPRGQGHSMQVSQTDRFLILRDLNTGQVSSLDLATLQITATTKTVAGVGVSVALQDDKAFVVDAVQGVVRQLDPRSLVPVGEAVHYPPGITGGAFDGTGSLWVAVPSEGTVSAVTAAPLPDAPAASGGAGGSGQSPAIVRTVDVADPSHDLTISTLDQGVAVLNRTTKTLTTVKGEDKQATPLTMDGLGSLPPRTNGPRVPVTVPDARHVWVVDPDKVQDFAVPGEGAKLEPAVAWAGRFYAADASTGTVYVFDASGKLVDKIEVKDANGPLELEVRENYLFINAPNSQNATVVDDKHQVRTVDKYANDVLGGDPPPPPPPPVKKDPPVGKPGAPRSVTATGGNTEVTVGWRAANPNGADITKYVVEGDGKTVEVGADQRSVRITGLVNGQEYRFAVHAVNAKGAGPKKQSNPVVPTSEVPDPPASVTAEAKPDGTVVVKWPAANGQGLDIRKYTVTAVAAGAAAPAGESTKTELVVPAGELEYGSQYAFQVVSVNERGGASKASPVSNSVVPFTTPEAPPTVEATTVATKAGTIRVRWAAPADNGRPITGYVVEANGDRSEVTGTTTEVGGFGEAENVTVKVRAVNEAGEGKEATDTARTVKKPAVTITGSSASQTAVTVNATVQDGGGTTTCSLAVGGKTATANCNGSTTVSGLQPSTAYTFTFTATNAAGNDKGTGSRTTGDVLGTVTCINGSSGDQRTYCNTGINIYTGTSQNGTSVGTAPNGTKLKAFCHKSGQNITSYVYNNDKTTSIWIQVDFKGGKNYIPYAWLNLDGKGTSTNTDPLPAC
ncbi:fibronectin type III domain-containing protein [Phytohabitans sp. ZYX-F-186]|uniref:Fibronectin type III domain-containing protein n=1 Tax=Phytohabitans maris TaxID=3071409 RepID=A0ABU0ZE14_9ACTN|nr:fibronectin type III domain-containing protein [Phytohabitans sp. ZYX-F-186]MDQ7905290.1 fibronectin type III domain-containing protein [Phytohabitans sp. ZYX-F-186]